MGHRLWAESNIVVDSHLSVEEGHRIAHEVRHELLHHLPYLGKTILHVAPVSKSGEQHYRIWEHEHDELPTHSH